MNRYSEINLGYSKRIHRFFATVIVVVVLSFAFTACNKPMEKLCSPLNLQLSGQSLIWDSVDGANGYTVKVGDEEIIVNDNTYELDIKEPGRYEIKVKANGDGEAYSDSDWSESLEFALI